MIVNVPMTASLAVDDGARGSSSAASSDRQGIAQISDVRASLWRVAGWRFMRWNTVDGEERKALQRAVDADKGLDERIGGVARGSFRRVVLHELAGAHDRDAVAHPDRLVDVVRDEDDRLVRARRRMRRNSSCRPRARDRIERAERLVHQHDRRIGGERARHADALLLPAGQLARITVAELRGLESQDAARAARRRASRSALGQPRSRGTVAMLSAIVSAGRGRPVGSRSRCARRSSTGSIARHVLAVDDDRCRRGSISRLIMRIVVVLPQPEGRSRTQIRPGLDGRA